MMSLPLGFAALPRRIVRDPALSDAQVRFLLLLVSYAWQDPSCFPGQERLASDGDWSVKKVQRIAVSLQGRGLIRIESRGIRRTNRYVLLFDPLARDSQDTTVRRTGHPRPPRQDAHVLHERTPVSPHYKQLTYKQLRKDRLLQADEHQFFHTQGGKHSPNGEEQRRAEEVRRHRGILQEAGNGPAALAGVSRSLAARVGCTEEEAGALLTQM